MKIKGFLCFSQNICGKLLFVIIGLSILNSIYAIKPDKIDCLKKNNELNILFNDNGILMGSDTLKEKKNFRDLYSDTWVASDALGREMPDFEEVGLVEKDKRRVVGIFYVSWHKDCFHDENNEFSSDITKIIKKDSQARLDGRNPLWKNKWYHWGEPEDGYYLSKDEYVIRKDISMLTDAGVDVLIIDVTNAEKYWEEWDKLFSVMNEIKSEGNKVPKITFWAFNYDVITVVQELYEKIYKVNKYKDLWFYWDNKPLMLYNGTPEFDSDPGGSSLSKNLHYDVTAKTDINNPHYGDPYYANEFYDDYTPEVKDFFTCRTMWWGYYEWGGKRFIGTEDNWSFGYSMEDNKVKDMDINDLVSTHNGIREEAAVTAGQHALTIVGKSWSRENGEPELNEYDMPKKAFVPWLGDTVENPEGYGIYFQERWDEAIAADPEFIYINDWNEWTTVKFNNLDGSPQYNFMNRKNNFYFNDQYNAEFNRCIYPMKNGYTDNYYMQMAQNIRKYKGARPIPVLHGKSKINIDGKFREWDNETTEYRDNRGDVFHRNYKGYRNLNYVNNSGRNDIICSKVAVDAKNIFFYVETNEDITSFSDNNWMLLLIDADQNSKTGWYGYDFLINKNVIDQETTWLMKYDPDSKEQPWKEVEKLEYSMKGNKLELAVSLNTLGLNGKNMSFDFKWSDNPAKLDTPISLCIDGDTAPNRRFNYRCIWKK